MTRRDKQLIKKLIKECIVILGKKVKKSFKPFMLVLQSPVTPLSEKGAMQQEKAYVIYEYKKG